MSWSIGYDDNWGRDIGYGVPAWCDFPGCAKEITRGLDNVCANSEPRGGEGCGLYFCAEHHGYFHETNEELSRCCSRCAEGREVFDAKPEHPTWLRFKLKDSSWKQWCKENPEDVAEYKNLLREQELYPSLALKLPIVRSLLSKPEGESAS